MDNKVDSAAQLVMRASHDVLSVGREVAPRGHKTREIPAWVGELTDPRARCCALPGRGWDPSFCLAEWLWYMRGSDNVEEISFWAPQYANYSDDGKRLRGAYGPRIMGKNCLASVVDKIKKDRDTRQAIVSVYDNSDLAVESKDVPCTLSWAFCVRDDALEMTAMMRSNDLFTGLPNDVFSFTMIQEMVARKIGIEPGAYRHFDVSLHAYERNFERIRAYSSSGLYVSREVNAPMLPSSSGLELEKDICTLQRVVENARLCAEDVDDVLDDVLFDASEWAQSIAICLVSGALWRVGKRDRAKANAKVIEDQSLNYAMKERIRYLEESEAAKPLS